MQDPCGRWNKNAPPDSSPIRTPLHALARLYPETPPPIQRGDFEPRPNESLSDTIAAFRALAQQSDPQSLFDPAGASHASRSTLLGEDCAGAGCMSMQRRPLVLGLSGFRENGSRSRALGACGKTLLDDRGWNEVYSAYAHGGRYHREPVACDPHHACRCRDDWSACHFPRLTTNAESDDESRPESSGASLVGAARRGIGGFGNPPVRTALNASFLAMLERPEPNVPVENAAALSDAGPVHRQWTQGHGTNEHSTWN